MEKQIITLPKGMTANEINICVEDDKIMVSYEVEPAQPEYQRGDVVMLEGDAMVMVLNWNKNNRFCYSGAYSYDCVKRKVGNLSLGGLWVKDYVTRLATTEEMVEYYKAFNDAGYEWDFDMMEFTEYVWKPKKGDGYYCVLMYWTEEMRESLFVSFAIWDGWSRVDECRYQNGNCFRTKEAAQAAADKMKEVLKTMPK